ncbi:MAG: hypothetical protein JXP73_10890 [Deltaproteobacteria bacterium]|nr:hypothetical protein [Deltaproteobacteria bacterium]
MKTQRQTHAFLYRSGVRILGTNIACDALGSASDLVFLSHARAWPARAPAARAGRRQFLATETTLRLLGEVGTKLRQRTLPAAFGHPFNLGPHRFELLPTGYLPGAASLLCETEGARTLYLGAFCPEPLGEGYEPNLMRRADAVCIDATCADPALRFLPRAEVVAQVRAFVEDCRRRGDRVALLGSAYEALPAVVTELAAAGIAMRAHRRTAADLARLRFACAGLPAIPRFAGKLDAGEVLLWPPAARASLATLAKLRLALVSGAAADPKALAAMGVAHGFALTNLPSFPEIVTAVEATGARQVALVRGAAESVASNLRQRGFVAYALGPPRQMPLPTGP